MQQHNHDHQNTRGATQPHLAQVRLEADMLRGAVLASALRGLRRGIRSLAGRTGPAGA
ncbi:hypothetical protein QWY84_05415 [Aquisalimonas lutea]|uniref:hypothetical protein n=1 Tax=Aquisalimonas lutea TaxID=1327750 RepID=UPI0025B57E1D|nr:hypothetical protein [Aquisalimonas lutea]MDN3517042.1 hypothetical protein [Aquisalimonas lutea]